VASVELPVHYSRTSMVRSEDVDETRHNDTLIPGFQLIGKLLDFISLLSLP